MGDLQFEKGLAAHMAYLRKFALRHYTRGDTSLADDLVQQTLLEAWVNKDSFRGESSFRTWLTSILRFKALSAYRESLRIEYGTPAYEQSLAKLFDEPTQSYNIDLLHMWDCIRSLPPDQQEVFIGKRIAEETTQELSSRLGIPEGTVKSRMHYANKHFQEALEA